MSSDRTPDPLLTQLLAAHQGDGEKAKCRAFQIGQASAAAAMAGNDIERQAMAAGAMDKALGRSSVYVERGLRPYYSRHIGDFGQPGHAGDWPPGAGRSEDGG